MTNLTILQLEHEIRILKTEKATAVAAIKVYQAALTRLFASQWTADDMILQMLFNAQQTGNFALSVLDPARPQAESISPTTPTP